MRLFEAIKETNKIHLANGTLYIDGSFIPEKPDIV